MSEKILITGGAGYIGSVLTPLLLDQGYQVTVFDNFLFNQNSLNSCCSNKNFNVVRGDVRIKDQIQPLINKHDIIIPLAAIVGMPFCNKDPIAAKSTNVDAMKLMFSILSKNQIILMPTTNSAYGTGDKNNFCDENSKLNPISDYAKHKVEVEKILMDHENSISFRLATVFGMSPRMRIDLLVNDFTYRAINDGFIVLFESHFKRNYIHINDVSRVFVHSIKNFDKMKNNIYNVGLSDANISKLELCNIIRDFVDQFIVLEESFTNDPDQRNYIVSNEKIEKTGFKTRNNIRMGIEELIKGYKMIKNSKYGNI
tara:strand:+ start:370 stop:1308 length:939 start_codon:yes stop_codon:yes gene_type:complete